MVNFSAFYDISADGRGLFRRHFGSLHGVHQRPEGVDVGLEDVADQHVGDQPLQFGVLPDELSEIQTIVKPADQFSHPIHAGDVVRPPHAQLGR